MANRFQDTEEWNCHFVRGLKPSYRAFWFWLKSACNHAGVWEIDFEIARMRTGFEEINQEDAEKYFSVKILKLECGEKWFLLNFCEDQYKTTVLNPINTAHRGVIRVLQKHNLIDLKFNVLKTQQKPLDSSIEATKDLVEVKPLPVKEIVIKTRDKKIKQVIDISDNETKSAPKNYVETPLAKAFKEFKEMRVKKRAPLTPRAIELIYMELKKLAGDDENLKIAILEQSIVKAWTDVFPLSDKTAFKNKQQQGSKVENIINLASTVVCNPQQEQA